MTFSFKIPSFLLLCLSIEGYGTYKAPVWYYLSKSDICITYHCTIYWHAHNSVLWLLFSRHDEPSGLESSSTGEENHFTANRDSNSSSAPNNHSNNTQESIINIRRPVFIEELPDLYASAAFADTLVRCADGSRRVHSLVLAAASSLLRNALAHVVERSGSGGDNLLPDFLILVPDLRLDELDAFIRPLYGESPAAASIDEAGVRIMERELFGVDFNNPDYRYRAAGGSSHSMENQLVKAEEKPQNSASGTRTVKVFLLIIFRRYGTCISFFKDKKS
jgi:hypothetical protein